MPMFQIIREQNFGTVQSISSSISSLCSVHKSAPHGMKDRPAPWERSEKAYYVTSFHSNTLPRVTLCGSLEKLIEFNPKTNVFHINSQIFWRFLFCNLYFPFSDQGKVWKKLGNGRCPNPRFHGCRLWQWNLHGFHPSPIRNSWFPKWFPTSFPYGIQFVSGLWSRIQRRGPSYLKHEIGRQFWTTSVPPNPRRVRFINSKKNVNPVG